MKTDDVRPARGATRPTRVVLLVGAIGLVITTALAAAAWVLNRNNEHRLLQVQTRQAAEVLSSAVLRIQNPLTIALGIGTATDGDAAQFSRFMQAYTGPGRTFVSAAIWRVDGSTVERIATVGEAPLMAPTSAEARAFVERATQRDSFVVSGLPADDMRRVAYAIADVRDPEYVISAERAIPADRRVPIENDSAFADLRFATYLGAEVRSPNLATTDQAPSQLPIRGDTVRVRIPFGDSTLTLVAAPNGPLGGSLGAQLPWIFTVAGVLLTCTTALAVAQLTMRRRSAERDARTITTLYDRLDQLYGEQRTIAETLQRALLPQRNPDIAEIEIASRYEAGARGVDIGGDWYSIIPIDEDRFAFVVGDVSGRGLAAAVVMARLRFTVRAYLVEGHDPATVLDMCSRQFDIQADGHFATVLVGVGDLRTREITLANAGHLNPLVVSASGAEFVTTKVGWPLGVAPTSYEPTRIVMPPGSTFLAYTDGLVERRDEDLLVSMDRLAVETSAAATAAAEAKAADPSLDGVVSRLVPGLSHDAVDDDLAVLAFRWVTADQNDENDVDDVDDVDDALDVLVPADVTDVTDGGASRQDRRDSLERLS